VGIAYADISTGEFSATQIASDNVAATVRQELERLSPAELIFPESQPLDEQLPGHRTPRDDWRFELAASTERLRTHLGVAALDGFGLGESTLATMAAGGILDYVTETQAAALPLLRDLTHYSTEDFMLLDAATRTNLELTQTLRTGQVKGSLLGVLDLTVSPMGRRLIRQWINKPRTDLAQIEERLDQVQAAFESGLVRAQLRKQLASLPDLERIGNRAAAGLATPRDLMALRAALQAVPQLLETLRELKLPKLRERLDPCTDLLHELEAGLAGDPPATLSHIGVIRPGYSEELDHLVESSRSAREWIANLESVERKRTGIGSLKVGYNKVFGYYIEVTKTHASRVPEDYLRKQTLVNAERYITPEMKDYEARVLTAEEQIRSTEARLFQGLCSAVGQQATALLGTARGLARADVVAALAEVAAANGYARPELTQDLQLEIREGRHPVVEQFRPRFVPNDTVFEDGERIRVITGPNMSGKSTYLRQVALIALMAQMGSFVPARSATIGLTDRIFTRIGAQDEIHAGQSTFMVEMLETANLLRHASQRSLLVLDEIGRGTSTYDGLSIAWAVVEFIHSHPQLRSRALVATHYHELTRLADSLPGVRNWNVAVSEQGGEVVFLHRIVPGGADKSYGIHVAKLAGLPRGVVQRAQEILAELEAESTRAADRPPSQLSLFAAGDPISEELEQLELEQLTPLEALNLLYELQQRLRKRN